MTRTDSRKEIYIPSSIPVDKWVEMLKNTEIFDEKILTLLKVIYEFEDHAATCTEVNNLIYGKNGCSFSTLIGLTGKKIKDYVKGESIYRHYKEVYDPWLFDSRIIYKTKYELKMFKNLRDAFEEVYPDLEINYKHNNGDFPIIINKDKLPEGYHDKLIEIKNKNTNITIWKIASGESKVATESWKEFREDNYVAIGWFGLKDLNSVDYRDFKSKEEIKERLLKENKNTKKGTSAPSMIWNFTHEIKVGDYVVVNHGLSSVYGIGIITSDYIPPKESNIENSYGLEHIRKVKWLITEEFEVGKTFFPQQTISEIKYNKWNKILAAYSKVHENFKYELLNYLHESFKKEYFETEQGQKHYNSYKSETNFTVSHYQQMIQDKNNGKDISDDVWEYLISPKGSIFGVFGNSKQFFKKAHKLSDLELKNIANYFFDTILKINESNANEQQKILTDYSKNSLSNGLKTGLVTPSLYFTNNDNYVINNKTINTIALLSPFVNKPVKITSDLNKYVENNKKVHEFLDKLSEIIPELKEFDYFDEFCHYICAPKLCDLIKGNPLPLAGFDTEYDEEHVLERVSNIETPSEVSIIKSEDFKLNVEMLKTDLEIKSNTINQLCTLLNAGKHIILEGVPGTGKTELAIDIGNTLKENNFCNGYIITTATSDWTTFDTIGGLMPDEQGNLQFNEGIFLRSIRENKLLIIDEINRADIDKAFGQLFTVLSGQSIELNYKKEGKPIKVELLNDITSNNSYYDEDSATYFVGNNWRIIASMNTSDKDSLFELSYAFMRRFAFVNIDIPSQEVYSKLINKWTNELDQGYTQKIIDLEILFDSKEYPKIGPAIFKDICHYLNYRKEFENNNDMLEEAITAFILPQFEGLSIKQVNKIYNDFIYELELNDEIIKSSMEEILGIPLKLGSNKNE